MPKYTHSDVSNAAKEIIKAFKSPSGEFKGFIVVGKLGEGKSSYCLKVMRDVFMALDPNLTEKEAYYLALQNFYFKVEPFLGRVAEKQREVEKALPKLDWSKRIPVMALDDASLYAGTDLYFEDQAMYSAFQRTMTTIRTATSGIIITAPAVESLTKCLRDYYSYFVVEISKLDDAWDRLAKIQDWYKDRRYKSGRRKLKEAECGSDEFTCHVPNKIYAKYLKPRMQLGSEAVESALAISHERAVASTVSQPTENKKVAEEVSKPKRGRGHKKEKRERKPRPPELTHTKILR